MKKSYIFLILLLVFSFFSLPAFALTITTDMGNGADSYIQSDKANSNFGDNNAIRIKQNTNDWAANRKSYLRFDLSSITETVSDIELSLSFISTTNPNMPTNYSIDYNFYGLIDGHSGETWDESLLTWNNAPGNDKKSYGGLIYSDVIYLGSLHLNFLNITYGDIVSFSSSALLDFINEDTNDIATLIMTRSQRNWHVESFASKENLNLLAPTLTLTTVPTPEPATLILLILGLFGVTILKKNIKA